MAKRLKKIKPRAPAVREEDGRPVVEHLDELGLPLSPEGCGRCEQKLVTACAHCGGTWENPKELAEHQAHSACGHWLKKVKSPQVRSFKDHTIQVLPPTPTQQAARSMACVHLDKQQHIVLELVRDGGIVRIIERNKEGRFELNQYPISAFEEKYEPIVDYPTNRAAALLVEFTTQSGADEAVLNALSNLVAVKDEERQMAATRTAAPSRTAAKAEKNGAAKKPAVKKQAGEKRESAAALFTELIMAGAKTDDQIFETVQKKFPNVKRGYVAWYRNSLKKKGMKVPEAKGAAKAAAKKTGARASA